MSSSRELGVLIIIATFFNCGFVLSNVLSRADSGKPGISLVVLGYLLATMTSLFPGPTIFLLPLYGDQPRIQGTVGGMRTDDNASDNLTISWRARYSVVAFLPRPVYNNLQNYLR